MGQMFSDGLYRRDFKAVDCQCSTVWDTGDGFGLPKIDM